MDLSKTDQLSTALTLEQVIFEVEQNTILSASARRDIASDVRSVARLIGRHPSEVPADVSTLRAALQNVNIGVAGITSKRFTNIRSSLARSLRLVRILPRKRPGSKLTPAWQTILDGIKERHRVARLARFVHYCSARRIEPEEVDDQTVWRFRAFLEITSLYVEPRKIADDAARAFNCVSTEQELGFAILSVSKRGRYTTRPLESYPESFQKDLADYVAVLTRADYFAEKGPVKPLRPASITKIKVDIRQVLNAAVESGIAQNSFTGLADLVSEPVIEGAFSWLTERNGGVHPVGLRDMAATLLAIAKHHVELPENKLRRLRAVRSKVAIYDEGMSDKNHLRLQQFDDWKNTSNLLCLPDRLLARAKKSPDRSLSATDALYATAITILLACPMRMKNLASLDLEEHLVQFGRGTGTRYKISVPGNEVKNGVSIDVELLGDASRVLTEYLRNYRHQLVGTPTTALFPSVNGGARGSHSLGFGISNVIRKETGLDVHPHLFRVRFNME
jgi:hypothetical protein